MSRRVKAGLFIIATLISAVGAIGVLATYVTPWPSVLAIRMVFDIGATNAARKLQKHVPADLIVHSGIPYDLTDQNALLDVYRPANVDRSSPTVVWIHGGGFVSGRRGDIANYLKVLASKGFVVVNVDYSNAPSAIYPVPVRQTMQALAFLRSNGSQFMVNPQAVVLAGDSAGAQIAAQVANLISSPAYAKAVGITASIPASQLKGVLLYCGVYDVAQLGDGRGGAIDWFVRTVTWAYSGKQNWRDAAGFERMAVVQHVTEAFPPTFISAGNADPLGPQSVQMAKALSEKGVAVHSLFYPTDHRPKLLHEYQFDLDGRDGRRALRESVAWLRGLSS